MTVASQICILEYGVSLSCKRGLKRTQTKTGVSEGGGEKIHANVNAAKREFRNALFSSKKRKQFYCQLSQRFSRRHWLLRAKGEFVRKLLEVRIMKTWVGRLFTQLKPKIGNAQSLFFEWKQNFLKRDQNATTWKRVPVLAKRSGSTL